MLEIKILQSETEKADAFNIREEVFVEEQGFALEIEIDEYDNSAIHVAGYINGAPVACGRLVLKDGKAKIGRLAVKKEFRKKRFGAEICRFLIIEAKKSNPVEIYLHSQIKAAGFYQKAGFLPVGKIFLEENAEHIKMVYAE